MVEQLHLNLAYKDPQDLIDPPGGLARMAKEMIQTSVQQQAEQERSRSFVATTDSMACGKPTDLVDRYAGPMALKRVEH